MSKSIDTQRIPQILACDTYLPTWIEAFLVDRKAQGLAEGSLIYYRAKLSQFTTYCEARMISQVDQISPTSLREYLLYLQDCGSNPGGVHAAYRALRAFLYWYELETEPEGWRNPIRKVKAPKVSLEPLEPVDSEIFKALLRTCDTQTVVGLRDRAILFVLLDTGMRAGELLAVDLEDLDLAVGSILVRRGKGGKPRTVFLGRTTRKAVRAYLRARRQFSPALWVTRAETRLSYDGLREMLRRRAGIAGVQPPTLHAFRRAFALIMLRGGTDIFTLAKLMGHSTIIVLQRYLKQTTEDVQTAHRKNGPVDRLG